MRIDRSDPREQHNRDTVKTQTTGNYNHADCFYFFRKADTQNCPISSATHTHRIFIFLRPADTQKAISLVTEAHSMLTFLR